MLYLAYTREDALFALQLTEDLNELGIEVWLDVNEIGAVSDWSTAQRAAIQASEGVVAVLSPEAMERDHMRREIKQAFTDGKAIYIAAARRSPWRDWLRDLPVADFTTNYSDGLDSLVLNIMGAKKRVSPPKPLVTVQTRPTQQKTPRKSWLKRLIKR